MSLSEAQSLIRVHNALSRRVPALCRLGRSQRHTLRPRQTSSWVGRANTPMHGAESSLRPARFRFRIVGAKGMSAWQRDVCVWLTALQLRFDTALRHILLTDSKTEAGMTRSLLSIAPLLLVCPTKCGGKVPGTRYACFDGNETLAPLFYVQSPDRKSFKVLCSWTTFIFSPGYAPSRSCPADSLPATPFDTKRWTDMPGSVLEFLSQKSHAILQQCSSLLRGRSEARPDSSREEDVSVQIILLHSPRYGLIRCQ